MRLIYSAIGGLLALAPVAVASAHTVWMEREGVDSTRWHVLFGGHAGAINNYPATKLKEVSAIDADGKPVRAGRQVAPDGVHLSFASAPGVIMAHYDNGIHTRRKGGPSVARPLDQVPDGISASHAVKWHKTIATWSPAATRMMGQPFEIVPLAATQPQAGKPMAVRVLIDGKPAAGIPIARNEEGRDAVTDAQGVANFIPTAGFNKIWSGQRRAVTGNPAYTEKSIEYSLGFYVQ